MSKFSFVKNAVNEQTIEETLLVMTYELGKVIQCQHYTKRYGEKGYKGYKIGEVADLISMIRMYCEQDGLNFDELLQLGEERYLERMEDLTKFGIKKNLKKELQ